MKNFYKKPSDYTTLPNSFAKDNRLSIEARGLGLLIFSLPDDWVFRQEWFYFQAGGVGVNRRKTVVKALNELISLGYLYRDQGRGARGRFGEAIWMFDPEGFAKQALDAVLSTVGTESADGSTSTVGTHSAGPESAGPQGTAIKEEFKKEEFKKEKNTPLTPQGEVGGRINRKKTLNIAEIGDIHGFTTSTIEDYLNFRLNSGGIDNAEAFEKHLLRELSSFTSPESNKLENWFTAWEDEQPAIKALAGEFLSIPAHWFDRRACRERGRDAFDNGWVKLEGYYVEIPGRGQEEIQAIVIEIAYQLAHEQRREDRVGFVDACRRVNQERLTEGVA